MASSSSSSLLQTWFPKTAAPFVCNAPMFGSATAGLAAAVSRAGGFGFIGGGFNFAPTSHHAAALDKELAAARALLADVVPASSPLPLGVGFITLRPAGFLDAVGPVLRKHRPQAVWLFAPTDAADHAAMIPGLKALSDEVEGWALRVFVQVGSVAAARQAAAQGADVVVAQGVDAGGHQWARGAGLVSIVPEVVDALGGKKQQQQQEVAVVAAGGIVDGRGVAAALALGAGGAVMGTRFLCADEAGSTENQRRQILAATDGGSATVKSTVHDDINGTAIWPEVYDGRAMTGESWRDHEGGMPVEENIRRFKEAKEKGEVERAIVWAGTGVGLIDSIKPAGEIVKEVQEKARAVIQNLQKL